MLLMIKVNLPITVEIEVDDDCDTNDLSRFQRLAIAEVVREGPTKDQLASGVAVLKEYGNNYPYYYAEVDEIDTSPAERNGTI